MTIPVPIKRGVKGILAKSPYRTHRTLPTMVPAAPSLVRAIDRIRFRRAAPVATSSLEARYPLAEIERHAACPLCGHDVVRIRYHTQKQYWVGQCEACALLYRVPAIRPERVAALYQTGDYSSFLESDYSRHRQELYRERLDAFSPMFDDGAGRTLLDFGCGTGLFLDVAAERGFDVHGVDLAPDSVERARQRFGVERVGTDLSDLGPSTPDRFDVVTLWSVLAHIAEPWDQIRELYELVAPGGRLLIHTVNADCLQRRAFGGWWNGFTKNHLIFWDEENLRRLLLEVGFSQVESRPFYDIPGDDLHFRRRLLDRHHRAVDHQDGGNMLTVVATR